MHASPLARYLLLAWVVLAVYASLYPLAGWRAGEPTLFAFLTAAWPRYVTRFDLFANFAGYVPGGLLGVMALHPALRGAPAAAVVVAAGALLSLLLETTQGFLPARDASNLDLLCNAAGALAGALAGAVLAPRMLERGRLRRLREALFAPGATTDLGLVLLGLWLFTQLNPAMLLFGAGDLRDLLAAPAGPVQAPALFAAIEGVSAGANFVAVSLLLAALARPGAPLRALVVGLAFTALVAKTAAFALIMRAENVFAWATPGARYGVAAGLVVALAAVSMGRVARLACAAVLLMATTVLVNLAPANPYLAAILRVWEQGHFLNFNGLTRLVSTAWPFAALAFLMLFAARSVRDPQEGLG